MNRRSFLRRLGIGAAGVATGAAVIKPAEPKAEAAHVQNFGSQTLTVTDGLPGASQVEQLPTGQWAQAIGSAYVVTPYVQSPMVDAERPSAHYARAVFTAALPDLRAEHSNCRCDVWIEPEPEASLRRAIADSTAELRRWNEAQRQQMARLTIDGQELRGYIERSLGQWLDANIDVV